MIERIAPIWPSRISYKVLTETLRRAERDGLVVRHLDGNRIEIA